MKIYLILLLSLISFISSSEHENNWAVLVAGSKGYVNYRHQSDVFHAYQVLIKQGFNPDNIIVFAYDDLATDPRNPFPGQIFNKKNGYDVYNGVKIDYKGDDVAPKNFLNVITGEKEAMIGKGTEKVLNSTSKDNVFIFFSDHGYDNQICFPRGCIVTDELIGALKKCMIKKCIIN